MLATRSIELVSTLHRLGDAREYALRVYRVDKELLDALTGLSPRLTELAASAHDGGSGNSGSVAVPGAMAALLLLLSGAGAGVFAMRRRF